MNRMYRFLPTYDAERNQHAYPWDKTLKRRKLNPGQIFCCSVIHVLNHHTAFNTYRQTHTLHHVRLLSSVTFKTDLKFFFLVIFNQHVSLSETKTKKTYLCPDSWAMVNASPRPVSSLMVQLRYLLHIPLIGAKPAKTSGSDQSDVSAHTVSSVSNSNTQVLIYIWENKGCFNFAVHHQNKLMLVVSDGKEVCRQTCIRDIKHTMTGLKPRPYV